MQVFLEPLKKVQVEGYVMCAEPEVLFGNLDELCCVSLQITQMSQKNQCCCVFLRCCYVMVGSATGRITKQCLLLAEHCFM
jgi:hypothetical protein